MKNFSPLTFVTGVLLGFLLGVSASNFAIIDEYAEPYCYGLLMRLQRENDRLWDYAATLPDCRR